MFTNLASSILNLVFAQQTAVDAVIVDLDGTMVDTLGDFEAALNLMLADLNLPGIQRPLIERLVGKGSEHLIKSVLTHVTCANGSSGADAVERRFSEGWSSYQRHYLQINGTRSDVYPGVVEGLAQLSGRGLKLACLTNKPTAFAKPLLEAKGLARYFSVVFGGDAFERKKPDPLPLLRTCEAMGTAPSRTLMLGDSSNDAQAARAAGCPVVLVTYGYNHGKPIREVSADDWIDRIDELFARC